MRRYAANPSVVLAACALAFSWSAPSLSAARDAGPMAASPECAVAAGLLRAKLAPKAADAAPMSVALLADAGTGPISDDGANMLWRLNPNLGAFPPPPSLPPDTPPLAQTCDWTAYGLTVTLSAERVVPAGKGAEGFVVCDSPAPPMHCSSQVRVPARGYGFSRPLISSDGNTAVVSFSFQCGPLCGGGEDCVMRRRADGAWMIDVCNQTWIS